MEASASQYDELKGAVDGLVASVTDAQTRVSTHLDNISKHVAELEAQVAANQPVDLSALKTEVEGAKAAVDSIDPAAALPTEPAPAGDAPPPADPAAPGAGDPPADPPPADPAPA